MGGHAGERSLEPMGVEPRRHLQQEHLIEMPQRAVLLEEQRWIGVSATGPSGASP